MVARGFVHACAGVGLLILSSCGTTEKLPQEPERTYLTHDELKALMSRTRTVRAAAGNIRATGVYAQGGIAHLDWGAGSAKGTWRIDGNRFCATYPGLRRGYETCSNLHKTGENRYTLYFIDGNLNGTWEVEK